MVMESLKTKPLKYLGYAIVLQEVPDEISLAFNVSGCPYHCNGCHSRHLWEYSGDYISQDIKQIIKENIDGISCICFMGGDQNIEELFELCKMIKDEYQLKICIYTGYQFFDIFMPFIKSRCLDYLKLGPYIENLGGLNQMTTNQRIYRIKYGKDFQIEDITSCFWKKYTDIK